MLNLLCRGLGAHTEPAVVVRVDSVASYSCSDRGTPRCVNRPFEKRFTAAQQCTPHTEDAVSQQVSTAQADDEAW